MSVVAAGCRVENSCLVLNGCSGQMAAPPLRLYSLPPSIFSSHLVFSPRELLGSPLCILIFKLMLNHFNLF